MKAESLFLALFAFFGSEFGDFDSVNVHCIGVTSFQGGGEHMVGVRRFDVSPCDFISMIPLSLEVDCLFVPVTDGGGDGVHGHDVAHEGGRNSSGVVSNKDVSIINFGHSYVVLE